MIYILRHQALGPLSQFPFSRPPSEAQIAAVCAICENSVGTHHPKLKEAYWLKVVELPTLGPSDIPEIPKAVSVNASGGAGMGDVGVDAVGKVEPQK